MEARPPRRASLSNSDLGLARPLQFARSLDLSTERRRVLGTFTCMGCIWELPFHIPSSALHTGLRCYSWTAASAASAAAAAAAALRLSLTLSHTSRQAAYGAPARQRPPASQRAERRIQGARERERETDTRQTHPLPPLPVYYRCYQSTTITNGEQLRLAPSLLLHFHFHFHFRFHFHLPSSSPSLGSPRTVFLHILRLSLKLSI